MDEPEVTPRKLLIAATCLLGSAFVPFVEATISPDDDVADDAGVRLDAD